MGDTQQPEPAGTEANGTEPTGTGPPGTTSAGTEATRTEAAAALAEIQRRQEQVIKTVLVPLWFWWVIAAAIVAIGAARDSGDLAVEAITIPVAVLVMVGLIAATIPGVRRRVQVHGATEPDPRVIGAIFGMIVLVDGVILGIAGSLAAAHASYPATIGCAAGAAVLVITGPLLNRYLHKIMVRQARQQLNDAKRPETATR